MSRHFLVLALTLSVAFAEMGLDFFMHREEGFGGKLEKMHKMCMTHCIYTCLANEGKVETCNNLMSINNMTLASLPDMEACPTDTSVLQTCALSCGCQCVRCSVCLMKKMNPMAAKVACMAEANPMMCMKEKRDEALAQCN